MQVKVLRQGWVLGVATLMGVIGLLVWMPELVVGQQNPSQSTVQSDELEEAKRLNQQVDQLYKEGKSREAIPLAERALAITEKALGPDHPDVATILNKLAALYDDQGKYSQAEPLYKRALAILEKALGSEHLHVAAILNNLAALYQAERKYSQAEPLYQRALHILEKHFGLDRPVLAATLDNLAAVYQAERKYSQAEPLLQRALDISEKALGSEHRDVAAILNNLALLYKEEEKYSQAEPLYKRALAILEKALGLEHPDVAITLDNLALLYTAEGQYYQAEPLFKRALAIKEKALGSEHPSVASTLNNLAILYYAQGKYSQSETLWQRALKIFEKALGSDHPDVAGSLNNLAVLYLAQKDISRAISFLTRGINIEEHNLPPILATGSERQKRDYMNTLVGTTYATISLHLQSAPNNPTAARLALTTILQRKGRILDALTDNWQILRQHLNPENQDRLDRLLADYSQLVKQFYTSSEQDSNKIKKLPDADEADQLEAELNNSSAEFRTQTQPVKLEDIQKKIPADAALVELVLYEPLNSKATKPDEKWGGPHYAAYVLHHQGDPKWIDLGSAAPIDEALQDFRSAIRRDPTLEDLPDNHQFSLSEIKQLARHLDEKLMRPVRQLLGNTRTVLLSPDSQLNLIPFAALVDEQNHFLIEKYTITYLTSGRDLLRLQTADSHPKSPLIVANPDFNYSGTPQNPQTANRNRSNDNQSCDKKSGSDLSKLPADPLPGTQKEATEIAQILPGATVLLGSQATKKAIQQTHSPSILHIATHGFFLNDCQIKPVPGKPTLATENPLLRSGLELAGFKQRNSKSNQRNSNSDDGVLTALEVTQLDLRDTQLVVLSACETGLGAVSNGEGVYGLRRAFTIAGAQSLVMSLWLLNDAVTPELMSAYYKRLQGNMGRSEALRATQLELLQKYQFPYYWASLIPSGNWQPMGSVFSASTPGAR